ncbi:hypothetical protein Hanom_Chr08g00726291 [Helianthus anomalus]
MDDIFLNPFSDMYAFMGNSGNNDTSSSNTNKSPPKERKKEAWELRLHSEHSTNLRS